MPKCPVKLLTGLYCPGCGSQRALHSVLHGQFSQAIMYNPFYLIAIPLICIWSCNSIAIAHTVQMDKKAKLICFNRIIIYVYVFFYIFWFIVRNV